MKVFVFINTELEKEKEVLQRLRGTRSVREVYMLYGTYDVVAVIEADSMEKLNQIYQKKTRIEGVQSATTMITIEGKTKQLNACSIQKYARHERGRKRPSAPETCLRNYNPTDLSRTLSALLTQGLIMGTLTSLIRSDFSCRKLKPQ